jgi:hypothetical protein
VTPDRIQQIEVKNPRKQTLQHHGSGRIFPECVTDNCAPDCD